MTEWREVKLENVCIKITDGSHWSPKSQESGYPMASVKDMGESELDLSSCRKISKTDFEELVRQDCKPKVGDVLIAKDGSYLKQIFDVKNEQDVVILSSIAIIRPNKQSVTPRFLKYVFKNPTFQEMVSNNYVSGAVIPRIVLKDFCMIPFSLPPLDVQKRIAGILGALDDRIDVLRRENVVLEQMAQAVFQSWFVDFDIVRAKAAGTPESEVCEKYHISPELYALFPSALTPDNLPLGWEKKSLPEIATYLNGLPLQKFPPKNEDEFLPVIKIAELKARSVVGADKASTDIDSKYIIDDGDVIFSWSGSLAVDIWCCGKGALNQHLFKVFSSDYPKWFYYLWTKSYLFQFQQIAAGKATTMGHIQRAHLEEAKANVPSEKILEVTDKIISPLIEKIIENSKQIRALSATRDALLPKLMNGEIEV